MPRPTPGRSIDVVDGLQLLPRPPDSTVREDRNLPIMPVDV
jgi:hypothetical protein